MVPERLGATGDDDLEPPTATRQRTSINAPLSANSRMRQPVASGAGGWQLGGQHRDRTPVSLGHVSLDGSGHFIVGDQDAVLLAAMASIGGPP